MNGDKMHIPVKLFSCLGVIITLFFLSACSAAPASPTPTETSAPSATPVPTDTPEPTSISMPTEETVLTAAVSQTMLAPLTGAPYAATPVGGATQPAFTPAPSVADKAVFIGQNFPDGTRFIPGTPVTIVWTVKNAGTTAWTTSYTLRYFAGTKGDKTSYAFTKEVPPGSSVEFTVSFVVPAALGEYSTWWKLTNGLSQNFSDVDFRFEASETAGPPKATPTP
jgi:hypothetical protein